MKEDIPPHDYDFLTLRPDLAKEMANIHYPRRTRKNPTSKFDIQWLNKLASDWPDFRMAAIEWLATRPTQASNIDLLRLDPVSIEETFTIPRSVIRKNLKARVSQHVKLAYQYFEIGKQVGTENSEPVMNITRKELLQLYIVAHARRYVIWKMQHSSAPHFIQLEPAENTNVDLLDQLMRKKPERGGPLFTA